ncbi:hypothetical protein CHCC20375_1360 [Bacillus licheniformis]|nr:hypothetical protein CHCC20375_1360 [Bacillus licheniformis]
MKCTFLELTRMEQTIHNKSRKVPSACAPAVRLIASVQMTTRDQG